jgi:hypothetical protein
MLQMLTQNPVLVKIRGVPDFPAQRIYGRQHRAHDLVAAKTLYQSHGSLMGFLGLSSNQIRVKFEH